MRDSRHHIVVWMVVGTLSFVALAYAVTLSVCAMKGIEPPDTVLSALKDTGLLALGAIAGLLARTRGDDAGTPANPVQTVVTNTPAQAIPTDPQ